MAWGLGEDGATALPLAKKRRIEGSLLAVVARVGILGTSLGVATRADVFEHNTFRVFVLMDPVSDRGLATVESIEANTDELFLDVGLGNTVDVLPPLLLLVVVGSASGSTAATTATPAPSAFASTRYVFLVGVGLIFLSETRLNTI